jgi:hypothetical protein
MLFPEVKQAISMITGICDVNVEWRSITQIEGSYPVYSFWVSGPMIPSNDTDVPIYVGLADTTNLRGRLLVEYLQADLVDARNYTYSRYASNGTYLGLGWSLSYRYVSYGVYQGEYYKILIENDERGIIIY